MAAGRNAEAEGREIAALGDAAATDEGRRRVRAGLASSSAYVVTKAAEVAARWDDRAFVDALLDAWRRLERGGARRDPGCLAKVAVVDALGRVAGDEEGERLCDLVFLPGARLRQWEAVWGGRTDTAGALRAACALGLVRWRHPAALDVLADHLADTDAGVRSAAARALAERGGGDGAPLLRLRVRMGDADARVLGECYRALLALAPEGSIALVARQLEDADDERFAEAALALGESRQADAFEPLAAAWESGFEPERRRLLLTAIAALRREEGVDFLLARVEDAPADLAVAALEAVAVHAGEEGVRRRARDAAAAREEPGIREAFERLFA